MSPGTPSVKGCSLSSRRPRSNGKPRAFSTSSDSWRWRAALNLPAERNGRAVGLHLDGLIDEPRELARQGLEDAVDIRGRDTRRERVDQRVVGREPARLAQERRLVAHQLDDFFEVRRENLKSLALRASTQNTSARAVALARRAISEGGVAMAWSRWRRISRRLASGQSSSCEAPASARSRSRATLGVVSKAWCSVSSAASCSPRTSALPRGIITAASQRSSESAPRNACRR